MANKFLLLLLSLSLTLPLCHPLELPSFDATTADERMERVRDAFDHGYGSWKRQCWGQDEVRPVTGECTNELLSGRPCWPKPVRAPPLGRAAQSGLALTLIDSLDTMWLMGRRAEFDEATAWVRHSLNFDVDAYVSVFEMTIRGLGGLLAAHWLTHEFDGSHDTVFLDAAYALGKRLLPAFDHELRTSGVHPLPFPAVNLRTGHGTVPYADGTYAFGDSAACSVRCALPPNASVPISEIGSLALEFGALSVLTGDPRFAARVDAITLHLDALPNPFFARGRWRRRSGLAPTHVQWCNGFFVSPKNMLTMSAFADSYYEYLLKVHALRGLTTTGSSSVPLRMYRAATEDMEASIIVRVVGEGGSARHLLARRALECADDGGPLAASPKLMNATRDMHHLACFAPGMMALAALEELIDDDVEPGTASSAQRLDVAREVLRTCIDMYRLSPTGLAPEAVELDADGELGGEFRTLDPSFHLRPEVVESLFMWSALLHEQRNASGVVGGDGSGGSVDSGAADCRATEEEGDASCPAANAAAAAAAASKSNEKHALFDGEQDDVLAVQKAGWEIFRAIERRCRTTHGFSGIVDVRGSASAVASSQRINVQHSFFLAETLKYLYLLFAQQARVVGEVDVATLLWRGVLSTEAHPLPRLTEVASGSLLALADDARVAGSEEHPCAARFAGSYAETCTVCRVGPSDTMCVLRCYCPDGEGAVRATMCAAAERRLLHVSNMAGHLAVDGAPCSDL